MFYILYMDHSKILGVVLAGGKSLRFGEDKSQVKLKDKSLIDYVLSEVIDEFKELLIISNNSIKFQKSEKISVIKDFKNNLAIYIDNGIVKLNTIKANIILKLYSGNVFANTKNAIVNVKNGHGKIEVNGILKEKTYQKIPPSQKCI